MEDNIRAALENIRPFLQRDGGDVEFVEYTEDQVVLVRLKGHCAGCPPRIEWRLRTPAAGPFQSDRQCH